MPVPVCVCMCGQPSKIQGQLFFAQLKPISIRMCAQCVAKRRAWKTRSMGKGEVEEGKEQQQNVDQPHYALYSMENLFIILRVSLLLFAGRTRTPIGLPTTPAWHPSSPIPRPCTTSRLTQPPYSPPPASLHPPHTPCVAAAQFCAFLLKLFRCASSISQSELGNCSPVEMKSSQCGKTITLAKSSTFPVTFPL